jgi:hypothetical protein
VPSVVVEIVVEGKLLKALRIFFSFEGSAERLESKENQCSDKEKAKSENKIMSNCEFWSPQSYYGQSTTSTSPITAVTPLLLVLLSALSALSASDTLVFPSIILSESSRR